jgi:Tol biopolymer transport system component
MGRVFAARDLELERSVAIKVLALGARDAEDDRRLEQEARTAGSLAHPNIVVVHDIGRGESGPYIVSELLDGDTLRQRLGGKPLPLRKAIDFGAQLSRGLAAAHERGLVHRDIKPENLFITRDGRLKILDFGIAKAVSAPLATAGGQGPIDRQGPAKAAPSSTTQAGRIVGTVAYMSPEQVRGRPADHRSDLFSAGAVLYEMLSGRPPFGGATSTEIAWAILNGEPAALAAEVPAALERVVLRCLEKEPAERFQSARDLAFNLEALLTEGRGPGAKPARWSQRSISLAVTVACVLALVAGGFGLRRLLHPPEPATFRQITFDRGFVGTARFAPDGETLIYSQARGDAPVLLSLRLDRPNARPVGLPPANLLAVSRTGEMAILLRPQFNRFDYQLGTLGRVPLGGGAVREVVEGIQYADWGPRDDLALVREVGSRTRLEFPPGHVLYETTGWISHPRFSPDGDRIAFIDHQDPGRVDDSGSVAIVDLEGKMRILSGGWKSAQGLAWIPGGREIWFTAAASDASFSQNVLRAVDLSGKQRVVAQSTGRLKLEDISASGRVVVTKPDPHVALAILSGDASSEKDLSWLEIPILNDLSADGSAVLLTEIGSGAQPGNAMFVRKVDGSPPLGLGAGQGLAFSPDGKWVLSLSPPDGSRRKLAIVPTGAGQPRNVETGRVAVVNARWLPGGEEIVLAGVEPGHSTRLYLKTLRGGDPRPISEEGLLSTVLAVSPDGTKIATSGPRGEIMLYPTDDSRPTRVRGAEPEEEPVGFGRDGSLFVRRGADLPAKIFRIDLARNTRSLWKTLMPRGSTAARIGRIAMTADGKSFAYNYADLHAQLFLLEGLD